MHTAVLQQLLRQTVGFQQRRKHPRVADNFYALILKIQNPAGHAGLAHGHPETFLVFLFLAHLLVHVGNIGKQSIELAFVPDHATVQVSPDIGFLVAGKQAHRSRKIGMVVNGLFQPGTDQEPVLRMHGVHRMGAA